MQHHQWELFVQNNLLKAAVIDGVCLLSQNGESMFEFGTLKPFAQEDSKQFLHLFRSFSQDRELALLQRGFQITSPSSVEKLSFQIIQKTKCSIYCMAKRSKMGLLVGNIPCGVLLCTYSPSNQTAGLAIKQFENFCDLMGT